MRKITALSLSLIIITFISCNSSDLDNDFYLNFYSIESATLPNESQFGESHTIDYAYKRPSTCHSFFKDLCYTSNGNIRTIAEINYVFSGHINCETQKDVNGCMEKTFAYHFTQETGSFIFKF